ncbi:MAG: 3-deoxy-D-manno-octulosonic acid transferase [Chthoniobacterales bacterium]
MGNFRLIRFIYNLFFPIVLLFLLPGFLHRMLKRGKYRHKFGQRFGFYSARVREKILSREKWIWMHAVSVGEVLIALKLIDQMKALDSDLSVVLSTTTSTGFALASEKRSEWLEAIYNPIDFAWTVHRAVKLIRPVQLILVEAEVWPNLVYNVKARGATIALVNARLSPRSESRYKKLRWFVSGLFQQLDTICVQEPEDISRWQTLGVSSEKIHCFGSVKFDDSAQHSEIAKDFRPLLEAIGVSENDLILLGGSTHAGEEKILARCYTQLRQSYPNLFFVLVPRHVERSKDILETLEQQGLHVTLRSQVESPTHKPDILLVDTTGELRDWYRYATVVFVGKSLATTGGQNPAEAISAGKAVVFGPHMENFKLLVRGLLQKEGAVQIKDEADLLNTLQDLLANPARRKTLAIQGSSLLANHRGAAQRTAQLLSSIRK